MPVLKNVEEDGILYESCQEREAATPPCPIISPQHLAHIYLFMPLLFGHKSFSFIPR